MKLELRFGGLVISGSDGDRFQLHTEPETTASVAELKAIVHFLDTLVTLRAGGAAPAESPQLAPAARQDPPLEATGVAPVLAAVQEPAAAALPRWIDKEPAGTPDFALPARTGAVSFVPVARSSADHMVLAESAVADAVAVPRAATSVAAAPTSAALAPAAPAPAAPAPAAPVEAAKPGRPIGGPQPAAHRGPGRPRTTPLPAASSAATAPRAPSAAAASTAPAANKSVLPGRPRSIPLAATAPAAPAAAEPAPGELAEPVVADAVPVAALEVVAAAPAEPALPKPVTKLPAQPAPKVRTGRLVDQLDGWMKNNPGPRSRDELIQVGIDSGWLNADDARRVFNMCMSRERDLFIRTADGNSEIYIRRAEALAPSSSPGKVIRRRPADGSTPTGS